MVELSDEEDEKDEDKGACIPKNKLKAVSIFIKFNSLIFLFLYNI